MSYDEEYAAYVKGLEQENVQLAHKVELLEGKLAELTQQNIYLQETFGYTF